MLFGGLLQKDPVLCLESWGYNADFPRFIAFISGIVRKYSAFYRYLIAVSCESFSRTGK